MKRLSPNHRTTEGFPSLIPYHRTTKGLFTAVPFSQYIVSRFQQTTTRQKLQFEENE